MLCISSIGPKVKIRGFCNHGVPQGSILGPLLFVILINDLLLQSLNCKVLMYADDTVIYYSHKSIHEIENCINSDAERIHRWMTENCLILNPKKGKTEFVIFASRVRAENATIVIDNNTIHQPDQYEYLGVQLLIPILISSLIFSQCINELVQD